MPGSVMALGPNILPVFEQLGILEGLKKISNVSPSLEFYDKDLRKLGSVLMKGQKELTGYDNVLFARPKLQELLLKQLPPEKILLGKRVLRVVEKDDQVVIHCADSTVYQGDILIGADGAHSSIRQCIYKEMDEMGILPKSDLKDFTIGFTIMVGVATPSDSSKFPQLQSQFSYLTSVIGGNRKFWNVCNVPGGQLCWFLAHQYKTAAESKSQQFRNSEWGPEANEAMISEFRDLPCPYGGTMGELIDDTPKDLISKVFVEEKMFETWYHGRTVLIGDGATNAMQDAVILANCLYDLEDVTAKGIKAAFQDYYDQRYPRAKAMLEHSSMISTAMGGQHWWERILRHIILNYIPDWIQQRSLAKTFEYRPQIAFLPLVENRGTGPVLPQKPSKRSQGRGKGTGSEVHAEVDLSAGSPLFKYCPWIRDLPDIFELMNLFSPKNPQADTQHTTHALLCHFLVHCTGIKSLKLSRLGSMDDSTWIMVADVVIPRLWQLDLSPSAMKTSICQYILSRCSTKLETLLLNTKLIVSGDAIDIVADRGEPLTRLKKLEIRWFYDEQFSELSSFLERCQHIEKLVLLVYYPSNSHQQLLAAMSHIPKLSEPRVFRRSRSATTLSNKSFTTLLSACHGNLRIVDAINAAVFGELSCEALLKHSSTLEELNLERCSSLDLDQDSDTLKPWPCESTLKVFKVKITNIPRPDITHDIYCGPRLSVAEETYPGEGRVIQFRVYERLARFNNLETL
ncbi:hypothetical protein BGZ51_003443 [Haplosporangium sp. Z 767]|nr:hypothetical protein BGZ51_003443 [Haplosporangium sp. Z 767]